MDVYNLCVQVYKNVNIRLQKRVLVYKCVNKLNYRSVYEFVIVVNEKCIQENEVYRTVYIFTLSLRITRMIE